MFRPASFVIGTMTIGYSTASARCAASSAWWKFLELVVSPPSVTITIALPALPFFQVLRRQVNGVVHRRAALRLQVLQPVLQQVQAPRETALQNYLPVEAVQRCPVLGVALFQQSPQEPFNRIDLGLQFLRRAAARVHQDGNGQRKLRFPLEHGNLLLHAAVEYTEVRVLQAAQLALRPDP